MDRRVRRSRDRLGDALVELVQEKPFDDIKVQDVLDRAGVGRSTFYAHFRDKEDLFLSDADEFFGHVAQRFAGDRASERLLPLRELVEHVGEMRTFVDALVESGRFAQLMELAEAHFARGIERRLAEIPRAAHLGKLERSALSAALAGQAVALVKWRLRDGARAAAADVDELFHATAWNGVGRARSPRRD